jgi:hypothetical protein
LHLTAKEKNERILIANMQKSLLYIVTSVTILFGFITALPIPKTPLPVFSGTQSTSIEGSYSQCCGGGATIDSNSAMTRSTIPAVNASLTVTGSCSGSSCDCYSSSQMQNVIDLTPLHDSCKGGSVAVRCDLDMSCQYNTLNITYVEANKGIDKEQYWPAPLNASCSSDTGNSCAHLTYLQKYAYSCDFVTMEYCTVNIPLLNPALTGGALLMSMFVYFGRGDCGDMECSYGGGGSYYTSCSLQSLTCP